MGGYDVIAVAAHPDDLEPVMGGTAAMLADRGMRVLFVDLCAGEPARYAERIRTDQATRAARLLGVDRTTLALKERFVRDTVDARLGVAQLIRRHKPRWVFTTEGCGVHPDHAAAMEIVQGALLYARLPKWGDVPGGDRLASDEPHEIERLFFAHCRMEAPWEHFDFAVDVTPVYSRKVAAITAYEPVFSGSELEMLDRYGTEDRYVGALVGVRFAEAFRARSPLLVRDPSAFLPARFG